MDKDILLLLVTKNGLKDVLKYYVDEIYKSSLMADSMIKDNNPIAGAYQLGIIMKNIDILKKLSTMADLDQPMDTLSKEIKENN